MTKWFCCLARRAASAIRMHRARNLRRGVIPHASEVIHVHDSSGRIAAGVETGIVDGMVAAEIAAAGDDLIVAAAATAEIVADIITVDTAVDITAGIIMAGTLHSGVHN